LSIGQKKHAVRLVHTFTQWYHMVSQYNYVAAMQYFIQTPLGFVLALRYLV
jgi:hypothetical protein